MSWKALWYSLLSGTNSLHTLSKSLLPFYLSVVLLAGYAIAPSVFRSISKDEERFLKDKGRSLMSTCDTRANSLADPDLPLVSQYSEYVNINNKRLRVVYRRHKLDTEVALIVFIHGLGGQAAQFDKQIEFFARTANVLAVDLVGHGKSAYSARWADYTTDSLVKDIRLLLKKFPSEKHVLVCHSYGCLLGIKATLQLVKTTNSIKSLILISPKASLSEKERKGIKSLRRIPDFLFNFMRRRDRKGGLHSHSVDRFLSESTPDSIRRRQLVYNLQSSTPVYKRMTNGMRYIPLDEMTTVQCPVLLIGGADDHITPPDDMRIIHCRIKRSSPRSPDPFLISHAGHGVMYERSELVNAILNEFLVADFPKMDPGFQLAFEASRDDKWSLKNEAKWKRTPDISIRAVGPSKFRAMKVLRQSDPTHSPTPFAEAHPEIGYIIDITHDSPPYDPAEFDTSQIRYKKLATTSKVTPTRQEVAQFIQLADECWQERQELQIAVHCHYGFNRTGFMICCYLIERLSVSVPAALRAFAEAKSPGIKHAHFIDELYLRYDPPQRISDSE